MRSSPLLRAKAIQVARLIESIEDPDCVSEISLGPVHDNSILPLRLNRHLVTRLQPGGPETLDWQSHLMLGRNSWHGLYFNVKQKYVID